MKKACFILFTILSVTSCNNKRCKDNEENARNNYKDTALMYLWRYSDREIRTSVNPKDSGFFSYKPNGDYIHDYESKYLNAVPDVWYTKDSIIYTTYCQDNGTPGIFADYKYLVRKDTLFLYGYSTKYNLWIPDTLIKVKKYTR